VISPSDKGKVCNTFVPEYHLISEEVVYIMIPENVSLWIGLIGNFGFPIAITVYLFIRFERKIDKLESVIMGLSEIIKSLHYKKGG
jgi:hypothetical protein